MALTTCSVTTSVIAALDDLPNDVGGLTAAELKAKFDEFATNFVAWFNDTHLPEVAEESVVTTHLADTNAHGLDTHLADNTNPHDVTKSQVGLGNVDNVKQMPIAGGTFTGIITAQNNTSYTTRQVRNIYLSTGNPSGGGNGDIWIKY